jgi:transcriptional regulator with XRE-family HTH domain
MAETSLRAGIAVATLRSIERGDVRKRPRRVLEWLATTLDTTVDGLRELAADALVVEVEPELVHA